MIAYLWPRHFPYGVRYWRLRKLPSPPIAIDPAEKPIQRLEGSLARTRDLAAHSVGTLATAHMLPNDDLPLDFWTKKS